MRRIDSGKRKQRGRDKKMQASMACALAFGLIFPLSHGWANEKAGTSNELDDFTLEEITVEAKRPDWETKLSPGTVSIIRPETYKGEQKSLPELLKSVPGVHVREVNGKGQYTTVSVRGSTAAQVGVFVDGVLFNLGGDAAADISTIPVQNVERIEVYRGYIPARFGGTYIGGVINIVTKRPTKANVQASLGKSSFGGDKASLQIDAPLGSGTLMLGINYEESEGDFKYKNVTGDTRRAEMQKDVTVATQRLGEFDTHAINWAHREHLISDADRDRYLGNLDQWTPFVENGGVYNAAVNYYANQMTSEFEANKLTNAELDSMLDGSNTQATYDKFANLEALCFNLPPGADWNALMDAIVNGDTAARQAITDPATYFAAYNQEYGANKADVLVTDKVTHDSPAYQNTLADKERMEKRIKTLEGYRYRKYNDYKNTDFIAKWQDEHWLAKLTWKEIDRHLPRGMLWNGWPNAYIDTDILGYEMAQTKQKIISKEALVGRRDTSGNLEWGWSLNYLDQQKRYKCENWELLDALNDNNTSFYSNIPMRKWSAYDSSRWGGMIDGTYKAGKNHLLEFMVNYSDEDMAVAGSGVTDGTLSGGYSTANRYRTDYRQKLFNIQLQDTITLNKKGDLWLTPSIRYNRSEINSGNAVGYDKLAGKPNQWMFEGIDQVDKKVTWQLALKKQVTDNLTLRATGGTYYRLLNLYEIAGDGAGILPAPIIDTGKGVTGLNFPVPEEGKQYDISAIWDGKLVGADSKVQLTYFQRKSENLLMLWRYGFDYWSYMNAANGNSRGVELQADFSWDKWDFSLGGTYLNTSGVTMDTSLTGLTSGVGTYSIKQPYTPEWEGFARLTYRPDQKTMLFGEVKYVDEMATTINEQGPSIQDALTTINLGTKYKFNDDWELAIGCYDIFNKGPELKTRWYGTDGRVIHTYNADYPIQGRTYYATLQCRF